MRQRHCRQPSVLLQAMGRNPRNAGKRSSTVEAAAMPTCCRRCPLTEALRERGALVVCIDIGAFVKGFQSFGPLRLFRREISRHFPRTIQLKRCLAFEAGATMIQRVALVKPAHPFPRGARISATTHRLSTRSRYVAGDWIARRSFYGTLRGLLGAVDRIVPSSCRRASRRCGFAGLLRLTLSRRPVALFDRLAGRERPGADLTFSSD